MSKFVLVSWKDGKEFWNVFDKKADAIKFADIEWNRMTDFDKRKPEMFCIFAADVSEDEQTVDPDTVSPIIDYLDYLE